MRKWLLLGLLAGLGLTVGCKTVAKTAEENRATQRQMVMWYERQIGDDWNLIWLTDRQGRLTKWQMR